MVGTIVDSLQACGLLGERRQRRRSDLHSSSLVLPRAPGLRVLLKLEASSLQARELNSLARLETILSVRILDNELDAGHHERNQWMVSAMHSIVSLVSLHHSETRSVCILLEIVGCLKLHLAFLGQ